AKLMIPNSNVLDPGKATNSAGLWFRGCVAVFLGLLPAVAQTPSTAAAPKPQNSTVTITGQSTASQPNSSAPSATAPAGAQNSTPVITAPASSPVGAQQPATNPQSSAPPAAAPQTGGEPQPPPEAGGFVFRTRSEEVVLHATVVDSLNRPVTGL